MTSPVWAKVRIAITRIQRLVVIVVVWLAFALASAMMFVIIIKHYDLMPTVFLNALCMVFLAGLLLAMLTEEHL